MRVTELPIAIVVFGMEGCPACSNFLPKFRKIAQQHNNIPAFAVDSSKPENAGAADHYGITVTPTVVLMRYGKLVKKFEGEGSKADVEKLFRFAEGR